MPRPIRPWFRFYVEATHDMKLRRLTPAHRWLWVAVLSATRESPIQGKLMLSDSLAIDDLMLSDYAGMRLQDVKKGMKLLQQLGLIELDESLGAWSVPRWSDRQYESDNVTKRTAKHRSQERDRNVPTSFSGTTKEHTRYRDRVKEVKTSLTDTDIKEVKTSLVEQGKHEEAQNLSKVPVETTAENPSVNKTESKTASGKEIKPRKRDLLFDAMAEACGHKLTELTKSSAAMIAKATSEIRPICKTPDEVWEKAAIYKKLHPDWVLTPSALAKYWSSLTRDQSDNQVSPKYQMHKDFEDEILARLARENSTVSVAALRSSVLSETSEEVGFSPPIHKPAPERPSAPSPSKRMFEESGKDDVIDKFEDCDTYEPDDWEDERVFGGGNDA